MPFPKLSPLQSRFAASLAASIVLLLVYLALTKPHFAYAIELDSRIPSEDHNHYRINGDLLGEEEEPEEIVHDKVDLRARAPAGVSALSNNAPQNRNINVGEIQNWVFTKESIEGTHGTIGSGLPSEKSEGNDTESETSELKKRQSSTRVYITFNTCLQPSSNGTVSNTGDDLPPQLNVYISLSDSNQTPGPASTDPDQRTMEVDGGYAYVEIDVDTDIYVGVSAPNTTAWTGIWNYEVAASIDGPYHYYNSEANLYFVDGDNHAALLITNDTTQARPDEQVYKEWMDLAPPWGVFASSQSNRSILGVRKSFCGLKNNARIAANIGGFSNQNVAKMTNRGLGGKPKEQFYITGLDTTSKYWGFLAMEGNSSAWGTGVVGGGGQVWNAINFETKAENNCALMYNLTFCSEVAYAVPTNPDTFSPVTGLPELAALYDSHAAQMYQYFNYSLQQIPCNTTSSAQYSLARNCDDCARAYKEWLCAVTIPRCADFSSTAPFLKPRNLGQPFVNGSSISTSTSNSQFGVDQALLNSVATNSSRNAIIDDKIKPGPYKEVLPCEDLCYDLVQSCPAALGFSCPLRGAGLEDSYGRRSNDSGVISCSYLGAAYYLSGAERLLQGSWWMTLLVALLVGVYQLC
jgi:calcium channel MID1